MCFIHFSNQATGAEKQGKCGKLQYLGLGMYAVLSFPKLNWLLTQC